MSFLSVMAPDTEIEYDKKTYKLGALTFRDIAEYVLWYQYKEIEEQEIATKCLPQHIRDKILEETHEKCKNKRWIIKDESTGDTISTNFLSWETPEVQQSTSTIEGIRQQCYLSLRVNHPEIRRELADRIVTPLTFNKILEKILAAQGLLKEQLGDNNQVGEKIPSQ